jgi:hypothetical protein
MTFLFSPHHFSYRSYRIKPLAFDTIALSTILIAGATDNVDNNAAADSIPILYINGELSTFILLLSSPPIVDPPYIDPPKALIQQ